MKTNKAKMIVATLGIVAGAATVGSISGTVAWFQYNTRVTAAYVGTSASVSRNLQIRIQDSNFASGAYNGEADANWKTNLEVADITGYLTAKAGLDTAAKQKGNGQHFSPVTFGKAARDAALPNTGAFVNGPKSNPMAGQFEYTSWFDAAANEYITIPLQVRLLNAAEAGMASKNIYLTDLTLQKDSTEAAANDLSSALRVHFDSTTKQLWSKDGVSAVTSAKLDLDSDPGNDKVRDTRYNWSGTELVDGVYGDYKVEDEKHVVDDTAVVASYNAGAKNTANSPMANDSTAALTTTNAIALGATNSSGMLDINVTIWLEGWSLLGGSAIWSKNYANSKFNVGMSFATPNVDA